MQYKSLLVVIPTRNRAEFAINAIKSVLNQDERNVEVVVSDNSTQESEVEKLYAFCQESTDDRLRYIRPFAPLPMTEHWDWAMSEVLNISQASHITYLTDRMIFKPFALRELAEIVNLYPENVISYSWDLINDITLPIISFQLIGTKKLFRISSQDLLNSLSESIFNYSLPRMLNCCCPRAVLEAVKEKYSYYFFSANPDFNFANKCLDIEDSILFYDYPLIFSYGASVSNGTNFLKGLFNKTDTTKDFIKNTKFEETTELIEKLPLSVTKHISYEYNLVKQLSNNSKFKNLDEGKLLRKLLGVVLFYEDKKEKSKALKDIFLINKKKFPLYVSQTYLDIYSKKIIHKILLGINFSNAIEIIKHHQSLEEAIEYLVKNPRLPTSSKLYLKIRLGGSPHELENIK
jgi:hypothetical protein